MAVLEGAAGHCEEEELGAVIVEVLSQSNCYNHAVSTIKDGMLF